MTTAAPPSVHFQGVPPKLRALWGENIRRARGRAGFSSQAELAKVMGCTRAAVSNWERGVHAPTHQWRVQLAAALHRSPETLFPDSLPD